MKGTGQERGYEPPITSLILPAYNPGPVLQRTWQAVQSFLARTANWEVIFVCDGCTDGSTERLTKYLSQAAGTVRVVSYFPNRGKGYAVRQGLAVAHGRWRVFTDVDLAYGFEDVVRVSGVLQDGADVAIASRTHPESLVTVPTRLQGYVYCRHLQSRVFSQLVRWLLPLRQRDTQAGLKGMSAATAKAILPHLTCDGFGFDCELLTAAQHFGLTIQELPVRVQYDDRTSTTSPLAIAAMVRDLWRIRAQWRRASIEKSGLYLAVGQRQAA
jgi:dolichyl-phosphate beta-glucosyltransferase